MFKGSWRLVSRTDGSRDKKERKKEEEWNSCAIGRVVTAREGCECMRGVWER